MKSPPPCANPPDKPAAQPPRQLFTGWTGLDCPPCFLLLQKCAALQPSLALRATSLRYVVLPKSLLCNFCGALARLVLLTQNPRCSRPSGKNACAFLCSPKAFAFGKTFVVEPSVLVPQPRKKKPINLRLSALKWRGERSCIELFLQILYTLSSWHIFRAIVRISR